jgi:hypothetical protein
MRHLVVTLRKALISLTFCLLALAQGAHRAQNEVENG